MKRYLLKLNSFAKSFILFLRPGVLFAFLAKPFLFSSNLLSLTQWIGKHKAAGALDDFYTPFRDHAKRFELYKHVAEKQELADAQIDYLEFGVYKANSFRWWVAMNKNPDSRFYGFDTFEGLPEKWGTYERGDMHAQLPQIDDVRVEFVKGLFQDTLFKFLETHAVGKTRMVIHIDADLFTSTLFALTTLARYLKKDDIIIFDEFNVPNHEYFAFKMFTESFYIEYELIGAVNNYYQCAFRVL